VSADESLLEYVMMKQEQVREAIPSFSMTFDVRLNDSSTIDKVTQNMARNETVQWRQLGQLVRVERHTQETTTGSQPYTRSNHAFFVKNNDYVATWAMGESGISIPLHVSEHDSLDRMTKNSIGHTEAALGGANLLPFAFGTGWCFHELTTFREVVENSEPSDKWTATRELRGGKEVFVVRCLAQRSQGDSPRVEAVIDPSQGFLTTSFELRERADGQPDQVFSYTLVPKEVGSGIWFPVELELHSFMGNADSSSDAELSIIVRDVKVDEMIPNELFSWESLGYPGGEAFRIDKEGRTYLMVAKGNRLVLDSRSKKYRDRWLSPSPFRMRNQ
jgi:hypothetical protein